MLDVVGAILIILCFIRGFSKGIILATFSVVAILLGTLCALKLSYTFATWLLVRGYISSGWAQIVSYIFLFAGVVLLVRLIAKLLQKVAEGLLLGLVNRVLGGLLYVLLGLVIWSSVLWVAVKGGIVGNKAVTQSKSYSFVAGIAPWTCRQAGRVIPFIKDTFNELDHFFDTINQKAQDNVGAH